MKNGINMGNNIENDIHIRSHGFEDLVIGMTAEYRRVITLEDVKTFSEVSGDINPLHLDETFASRTMFKSSIIHGIYTASFISAVIGTQLPGPGCIYLSQSLRFLKPVRVGEEVKAVVIVGELFHEKHRVKMKTECRVDDKVVLTGEALIQVPTRAEVQTLPETG